MIHNIAFFGEKVVLSESRREMCTDQAAFTSENSPKLICWFVFDVRGQRWTSLEEAFIWILYFSNGFELKRLNDGFVLLKPQLFSSQEF